MSEARQWGLTTGTGALAGGGDADSVTMAGFNTTASRGSMQAGNEADDAIWILTSTFIIFTMQSGFGLLESGSVSTKNEVNIMVKNAADVIFGGLTYWAFGYAFSFGKHPKLSNWFNGWGYFFVEVEQAELGPIYSHFFFQASFATTATTIVSGSMAERTKLSSYIVFSLVNTLVYCFPAHWVWSEDGWLAKMGMIDVAGAGPVHLVGGVTGLVATMMLKPRYMRYESKRAPKMGSPTNALLGTFMLWWGWLGFNCGSTFGISGYKWVLAARSAVSTLVSSVSGGAFGFLVSYIFYKRKYDVGTIINSILGSLVGITAFCAFAKPWESFIIGIGGAAMSLTGVKLLDLLKIDDPVGAIGVHGFGAIWSLILIGLFAKKPDEMHKALLISPGVKASHGLFYGGGWYLLGVQTLGVVSITAWSVVTSYILLKAVDLTMGLRVSLKEEILGADLVEHGVGDMLLLEKFTNGWEVTCDSRPGSSRPSLRHVTRGEADGDASLQDASPVIGNELAQEVSEGFHENPSLDLPRSFSRYHEKATHTFGSHFCETDRQLQERQLMELRANTTNEHASDANCPLPSSNTKGRNTFGRTLKYLLRRRPSSKHSFSLNKRPTSRKNSQDCNVSTISHSNPPLGAPDPGYLPTRVRRGQIIHNPVYNSTYDTAPSVVGIIVENELNGGSAIAQTESHIDFNSTNNQHDSSRQK